MTSPVDPKIKQALQKKPSERTQEKNRDLSDSVDDLLEKLNSPDIASPHQRVSHNELMNYTVTSEDSCFRLKTQVNALEQTWANYSPWATCGPPAIFIQPASLGQGQWPRPPSTSLSVASCTALHSRLVRDQTEHCKMRGRRIAEQDLNTIYSYLRGMDILSHLREHQLRIMSSSAHDERYKGNQVLFCSETIARCWYILLSGSVLMKDSMFLSPCGFGKQSGGKRGCECIILEPSEMIMVENSKDNEENILQREVPHRQSQQRFRKINQHGERQTITDNVDASSYLSLPVDLTKMHLTDSPHPQVTHVPSSWSGCSIASDSGNSSLSDIYQATESDMGDVDLTGLPEAPVDSEDGEEDEDIDRTSDPLLGRDVVRECLEKKPADKTDDDIEQLLEFMHQLPAFANMTMSVRRELCSVMIFEVVEQAGAIILEDGQELDSWYVILNGMVEISYPDGKTENLCMGNSFGITPSLDKQYMNGVVRTKVDDCQFVCIAQQDYWWILNHVEKNTHKVEEEGKIVMVKEHRELDRSGTRKGHIVIKATPERLIMHLIEEHSMEDPTYIEDFLLTYRTFLSSPLEVGDKLLEWFKVDSLRDEVGVK